MARTIRILAPVATLMLAACGGRGTAPPQVWQPALSEGRLQHVETNMYDVRYVALDDLAGGQGAVRVTVLVVGRNGTGIDRKYPLLARRETIDCAARAIADETGGYFNGAGELVETKILTGAVGRDAGGADGEVKTACDAAAAGKGWIVKGWRAARRESQTPPDGLAAQAKPDDPDAMAWLCAAAARGAWSAQTVTHCAKAIALLPNDPAPRIDRAFIAVHANRLGPAEADLRAATEKAPDNAAALFGRSVVAYLKGDKAGSLKLRVRALDLDPMIADRLERSYGLTFGSEFRSRER